MSLPDLFASVLSCIDRAEELLAQYPEDRAISGSQWSLHAHLEHLALTGRSTPVLIAEAHGGGEAPEMNANGVRLFELGAFPRGKTQAPDFAIPKGSKVKKIQQGFVRFRKGMEDLKPELEAMSTSTGRALHPALGGLTAFQWWVFLDMHQRHHLEIISDGLDPA